MEYLKKLYDLGYCTPILRDPQESSLDPQDVFHCADIRVARRGPWAEAVCGVGRRLGRFRHSNSWRSKMFRTLADSWRHAGNGGT